MTEDLMEQEYDELRDKFLECTRKCAELMAENAALKTLWQDAEHDLQDVEHDLTIAIEELHKLNELIHPCVRAKEDA